MGHRKEVVLNSLLAAMVLLSVLLSSRIWFSTTQLGIPGFGEARVQSPPPNTGEGMPPLFRPERIYLRPTPSRMALVQTGSAEYERTWTRIQALLTGLKAVTPGPPLDLIDDVQTESVTVVLPLPLPFFEWADHWNWTPQGARTVIARIDRFTLRSGQSPGLYVSGPTGDVYRLAALSPDEAQAVQAIAREADPASLRAYRPLAKKPDSVRVLPGLMVPDATSVPVATVVVGVPNDAMEEARYFPDLSVVRQIDERDARSFTDGQRLLRITTAGVLEYRTVQAPGVVPELARSLSTLQEWLAVHGGWPSDLVLDQAVQDGGVTKLRFDVRSSGPYPIETSGGAIRVEITADRSDFTGRVVTFRRTPQLKGTFGPATVRIMPVEEALVKAVEEAPVTFLTERVREIHLAYEFGEQHVAGVTRWVLLPVWVVQVGDARLYVSAVVGGSL